MRILGCLVLGFGEEGLVFGGLRFDVEPGFVAPLSQVRRFVLQYLHSRASLFAGARGCSSACL